jgi:hypothetical protein
MVRQSDLEYGRRRLRRFVYLVVALIALAFVVSRVNAQREPRPGSEVVAKEGRWHLSGIPTTYRATFRVETRAQGNSVVNTERVWFRRPFQSRIETWGGEPPGKSRLNFRQSVFGVLTSVSPNADPLNVAVSPSVASGDLRIEIALRDAIRRRVVVARERRRVYGRECQVYRAGGPVAAGDIVSYSKDKDDEYADFCVERHGIVVEEWWVSGGKLLRRRAATDLRVGGRIDSSLFKIDVPEGDPLQRGSVVRVTTAPEEAKLWTLPQAPSGYRSLGRFIVSRPSSAQSPLGAQDLPLVSTSDVFVRGPDLIVVDQNAGLARAAEAENRTTYPVTVKGFKSATLVLDGRANEVRIATPDNSYVRIIGTVPPETLIRIAGQLKLV